MRCEVWQNLSFEAASGCPVVYSLLQQFMGEVLASCQGIAHSSETTNFVVHLTVAVLKAVPESEHSSLLLGFPIDKYQQQSDR